MLSLDIGYVCHFYSSVQQINQMDHPAALHLTKVDVPATVEHSSEAGPETGKWVAESMRSFITFMHALKLRLRARDQLHPILQEMVTGYARFKGRKDWEGRSRMVGWLVNVLNFLRRLTWSLQANHPERNHLQKSLKNSRGSCCLMSTMHISRSLSGRMFDVR